MDFKKIVNIFDKKRKITFDRRKRLLSKLKDEGLIHDYCHNPYSNWVTLHLGKGNRSIEFYIDSETAITDIRDILRGAA